MRCLELPIPPLPQLITAGHAVWKPGMQHFRRSFQVFDLLLVCGGTFHITEDDQEYNLQPGELLVLEPGKTHWGHRPVLGETEIYWVHFTHPYPYHIMEADAVPWSRMIRPGTDADLTPTQQTMYLPKHARIEVSQLRPTLDEIVRVHHSLTLGQTVRLHALASELLSRLQSIAFGGPATKAQQLCDRVIQYLHEHIAEPFDSRHMERELHYHFDYLSRCLKQYTKLSPLQYKHHLQMERAQGLLRETDLDIQAIAEAVGLPNGNYFVRLFRKHTGLPPGKYRAKIREVL